MYSHRRLYSIWRGDYEEISIYGEIFVWGPKGVVFQSSPGRFRYPARSILKPFQFLAADLPAERWETPGVLNRYTAAIGSVSADQDQISQLEAWYRKGKAKSLQNNLQVPEGLPIDPGKRGAILSQGKPGRQLYHNCFSKHMAILEACDVHGWDPTTYRQADHPFQQRVMSCLSELLGKDMTRTPTVVDGCTLRTPILGLGEMAQLYFALANAKGRLGRIREMMHEHPEWIGGPGRLDTGLMQANPGKLVAKEGADGLLCIGIPDSPDHPGGLGIVLKVSDGDIRAHGALALAPLLTSLGLRGTHQIPPGQEVRFHYAPAEKPGDHLLDISPPLHPGIAVWPGDVGFSREVALDTEKNDHLTLSAIRTTVHVGAHTDAPNHYGKGQPGIDEVDLHAYYGPAQVVDVGEVKGVLKPENFEGVEFRASRLLLRTGSFPNPDVFNEDFVALSPEAVELFAKAGIVLVGIDTPSIDPFSSKELPAHKAVLKYGISILEGIVLDNVAEGMYHLSALPLPIRGGDASPVRAVLLPL